MEATRTEKGRTRATRRLGAGGRRSSKRRKAVGRGERQIACLELRSHSVVLKPRIAGSGENSRGRSRSSPELGLISRCSTNASCEAPPPLQSTEPSQELDTATLLHCNGGRRGTTASSNHADEVSDLESKAERESRRRSTVEAMPSEAELEDFFAAEERDLRRRFAERYNFDVVKDAPLAGRYEWIPLTE